MRKVADLIIETRIQLLIIFGLTLLAYSNIFNNQFVWDDKTFIGWDLTRSFDNLGEFLKGALPPPHKGDYRPLKGIILTIDYALFGTKVFWYHMQSILIHFLGILAVYLVSQKLLMPVVDMRFLRKLTATVAALIFALHPVQVEAITFVTSSTDILGIPLMLAAFYFYLDYFEKKDKFKLILSFIFASVAFVTYEIALTLPILLFLYDFCLKRLNIAKFKIYLVYLVIIGIYLAFRIFILDLAGDETYLAGSFYLTILAILKAILRYFQLVLAPINLSVNHEVSAGIYALWEADYNPVAAATQAITEAKVLMGIAILAVLAILFLVFLRFAPFVSFCIGLFFIPLIPVLNLVPISTLMAERYLYLPIFGFGLLVGYATIQFLIFNFKFESRFLRKTLKIANFKLISFSGEKQIPIRLIRVIGVVGFIVLISFYSARTFLRNRDWQDAKTLWSQTLKRAPASTTAHHNLGVAYLLDEKYDLALEELKTADATNSKKLGVIPLHLGLAYLKNKQSFSTNNELDLADSKFRQAIEYDSNLYEAYYNLGTIAQKDGRVDEAIANYKKAVEISPYFYDVRIDLGIIYAKQDKVDRAFEQFEAAQKINPRLSQSYQNLAVLYYRDGQVKAALEQVNKGLKYNPGNESLLGLKQKLESGKKEVPIK